jgi:translation elongation factor EF-Tu-like GTPase
MVVVISDVASAGSDRCGNNMYPPDIEVRLIFLPTDKGGRRTPARSGYRPQFYYNGNDWDAVHTYPDKELVYPGETVRAFLSFLTPQNHVGKLRPGMEFQCREGQRRVAKGVVLKILVLGESAARDTQKAR